MSWFIRTNFRNRRELLLTLVLTALSGIADLVFGLFTWPWLVMPAFGAKANLWLMGRHLDHLSRKH